MPGREPVTTLVAVRDGRRRGVEVLASGEDFYSTPRLSPDGRRLVLAPVAPSAHAVGRHRAVGRRCRSTRARSGRTGAAWPAARPSRSTSRVVAGRPRWSSSSDRDGWWRLYRRAAAVRPAAVASAAAQPLRPRPSSAGRSGSSARACWAQAGGDRLVVTSRAGGRWSLGAWTLDDRHADAHCAATSSRSTGWPPTPSRAVLVGGLRDALPRPSSPWTSDSGAARDPAAVAAVELDRRFVSVPEAIEFPTTGGRTAHAFYYPPRNRGFHAGPPASGRR